MGAVIISALFKILRYQIGLPVGVILAVGLWATFDKTSGVRQALDAQTDKFIGMVASEQLTELERRRVVAVDATIQLRERLQVADGEAIRQEREFDEYAQSLESSPGCVADPEFLNGLLTR